MNKEKISVHILLSTYNGEEFLHEQLDSILVQTYEHWKLFIRDDDSKDGTPGIIQEYLQKYPEKIFQIKDNLGNIGYKNSFAQLMLNSDADYVLFSDQDDFWMKDKIEIMLAEIISKEMKFPSEPILICSDIMKCDTDLKMIEKSYFNHIGFRSERGQQSILLASVLHGCAFILNKKLLDIGKRIIHPTKLLSQFVVSGHDNFLSVVCAMTGKIFYINQPLIKHRIHGKNLEGFSRFTKTQNIIQLKILLKFVFYNKGFRSERHAHKLLENKEIIESVTALNDFKIPYEYHFFLKIDKSNYFKRKYMNVNYPFINHYSLMDKIIYVACF